MRFSSSFVTVIVAGVFMLGLGCNSVSEADGPSTSTSGVGGMPSTGGGSADGGGGAGGAATPCPTIAPALSSIAAMAHPGTQQGGVILGVASPTCPGWVGSSGGMDPVPVDGLVKYASASRLLVAAAVMSLVDDGDVALSDTLDQWRPSVPNAGSITVRMLLNQTSGLANHFTNPTLQSILSGNPRQEFTPDELIDFASELPATAPGGAFESEFINFILLGVIIEAVTGKSAHDAIRERVITPLGLSSPGLLGVEVDESKLNRGYSENGQEVTSLLHPSAWWVAASYAGDVSDMVRLLRGVFGSDAVLSPAARASMVEMPIATGVPQFESGLGLYVESALPHQLIGQEGSVPGYEVRAYYVPEFDAGITVLATNDGAATRAPLFDAYGVLAQPQ